LSLQINITKATKILMSKLTVTEISKAVLTKSDDHTSDLGILAAPLKCNWSHESSMIEVSACGFIGACMVQYISLQVAVKSLSDDINSINDVNKACTVSEHPIQHYCKDNALLIRFLLEDSS
jgi:hypothetical protein